MRPAVLVPSVADLRWIRFHLVLGYGSMRWLPPFLMLALWSGLGVLSPGPGFAVAAALFPAAAIWAAWTTIAIGSVDDDPHYDLLAAAAGSVARLHRARAATVAVAGTAWAVTVALVITPLGSACSEAQRRSPSALQCDQPRTVVPLVAVTVLTAGVWAGIGIGTLLHRPIVARPGRHARRRPGPAGRDDAGAPGPARAAGPRPGSPGSGPDPAGGGCHLGRRSRGRRLPPGPAPGPLTSAAGRDLRHLSALWALS